MNLPQIIENQDGKKTVDARELHLFLEVKTRFNDWIRLRIEEYSFVENLDYHRYLNFSNGDNQSVTNPRPPQKYLISLDMAKELAMVERNEKGREARRHFIESEKKAFQAHKAVNEGTLLTHGQVLYLVELKEVFKYISHCEDAERMNHAAFVSKHKGGENPHAAFHRMRNTILEMKPEDVDARIRQYCLENSQRVPKSKRAKLEMLNPYEVLRNGVWDFLHGRGRMDALPLANLVRGMAEREGTAMFRRNQTDLFRQQQDVSIPQLA